MKQHIILFLVCLAVSLSSCKKFLDQRQNSLQAPLNSVEAFQIVLNNAGDFNYSYPTDGECYADNYEVTDGDWATFGEESRKIYLRLPEAQRLTSQSQLITPAKTIYNMNVLLEMIAKTDSGKTAKEIAAYNQAKGTALFFRGYCFYELATLYAKPYDPATANDGPGMPVRVQSDFTVASDRGTVKQTYDQIIKDLKDASSLLPTIALVATQPSKVAAYAELARVYLSMEEYALAGAAANSALQLYSTLIDYNTLDVNSGTPFSLFNQEVIFHTTVGYEELLDAYRSKVSNDLFQSYAANDLRKTIFFKPNGDGSYYFTGNYNPDYYLFNGLATDELYLIRAECNARAGSTGPAMTDLNALLSKRWSGTYVPMTASSPDDALTKILRERRKELPFRGLRWADLRRLNRDTRFAVTLTRTNNGTTYTLPPNDLRYTVLFPLDVIANSGVEQNPR